MFLPPPPSTKVNPTKSPMQFSNPTTTLPPVNQPSPFFSFLQKEFDTAKQQDQQANILHVAAEALVKWDNDASIRQAQKEQKQEIPHQFSTPFPGIFQNLSNDQPQPQPQPVQQTKAPKKPLNPFAQFAAEQKEQVRTQNPNIGFVELEKLVAEMWTSLPEEIKEAYNRTYEQQKEEYKAWREQHPEYKPKVLLQREKLRR